MWHGSVKGVCFISGEAQTQEMQARSQQTSMFVKANRISGARYWYLKHNGLDSTRNNNQTTHRLKCKKLNFKFFSPKLPESWWGGIDLGISDFYVALRMG
jgi:hypothetical protein